MKLVWLLFLIASLVAALNELLLHGIELRRLNKKITEKAFYCRADGSERNSAASAEVGARADVAKSSEPTRDETTFMRM